MRPMAKRTSSEWAGIGAAAVVASLLYVGFEIHRNTRVGLASNRQAIASRARELALYSAEARIHRLLSEAGPETIELSEEQQDQLIAYVGALLRETEEAFLLYRDELLDDEYRTTRAAVMLAILRSADAREVLMRTRDADKDGN